MKMFVRRKRPFTMLISLLMVFAVACSTEQAQETSDKPDTADQTRVVSHAYGELEIPSNPQRIVDLGWYADSLAVLILELPRLSSAKSDQL
jgi:ABC-type Fe3+-hydroxamate transport system substrate-binding protein